MIRYIALATLALAACAPAKLAQPKTLADLYQAHDWQHEPGEKVEKEFAEAAMAILKPMTRADAITSLNAAGYECTYGEASDGYPDPAAQCTRSFATRACQMDWEIFSTADKGKVDEVTASFRRDCVGTEDDWPDKVNSPIDNQLAPAPAPTPT
ncbi:MAG TPA: hypothetical protein VG942_06650 [Hyphomonadaceae bacterium]|nr:hypothetical protein [Hyphomonadaceae bacterium]